jgi:hypothetical protein
VPQSLWAVMFIGRRTFTQLLHVAKNNPGCRQKQPEPYSCLSSLPVIIDSKWQGNLRLGTGGENENSRQRDLAMDNREVLGWWPYVLGVQELGQKTSCLPARQRDFSCR